MDIEQRIADILRGKVVLLKHETMEDLAGVLVSELGLTRENIRKIVTSHIGNTFGSGDEVADDIFWHLTEWVPDAS